MFLSIQDEIAIVLCYRDAIDDNLLLSDGKELKYKDHMNNKGINYTGVEHLEKLELGRLLDADMYYKFSKDELYSLL